MKFIVSALWERMYCPPCSSLIHIESFVVGSRASIWQNRVQGTKVDIKLMHYFYVFIILNVPTG